MNRSLTKNMILNTIKTAMSIIFPLITFTYASRVLGTYGIGNVGYSESLISYFTLIAGLGISTYGIREVAKVREKKDKMNELVSELLTINIITCFITYFLFVVFLQLSVVQEYKKILIIQSAVIFLSTIGMEWLFVALEEYKYITVRSIIFQCIAIIFMFLFVKKTSDYCIYAAICVFASSASQILNLWYSREFVSIKIHFSSKLKKHIKPIMIIFGTNVASIIYMSLDTTMLGIMKNVDEVGLYTAATKIIKIISTILASISTVMLPRLSFYIENKMKEKYEELLIDSTNITLMFSIPCSFGLAIISKDILYVFSGKEFESAYISLIVLAINQIFSSIDRIFAWQILMPVRKEKIVLISTIVGALSNFILNIFVIKLLGYVGAAITTMCSEIFVFIVLCWFCRNMVNIKKMFYNIWQYFLGGAVMVGSVFWINNMINNIYIRVAVSVLIGGTFYFTCLLLIKNKYIRIVYKKVCSLGRGSIS